MEVHASDDWNIYSQDEDYPVKASEMKDFRHPAQPIAQNVFNLEDTININENPEEGDYHMVPTQLPGECSKNPQF